jgi:hypothetical protein
MLLVHRSSDGLGQGDASHQAIAEAAALPQPMPLRMETQRWIAAARRAMSCAGCNGPRDMTERDPMLEPFDALIGTWATEATHPLVDEVVPGAITFEWLEGGRFLIQRSRNDHELFPDAICVIGAPEPGDGLVMESFDSRGVRRTYGVSLDDGVLRMWREHPGFDQRFSATLGPDAFEGQWQLAETPGDWHDDLKVTYRRRD